MQNKCLDPETSGDFGVTFDENNMKVLLLNFESEVTSEHKSNAKHGNLFSAERNQFKVKTE